MVGAVDGIRGISSAHGVNPIAQVASAMSGRNSGLDYVTPVATTNAVPPRQVVPMDYRLPAPREGVDPVEMAVRGRITPFEPVTAVDQTEKTAPTSQNSGALPGLHSQLGEAKSELALADLGVSTENGTQGQSLSAGGGRVNANGEFVPGSRGISAERQGQFGETECETCNNRKYVDGSDDGSVSFQTPTHISPEQSAAKVMSHEQEHVVNEQRYAERDGREVLSQDVQIFHDICPDCGGSYVSGGLTTTVTAEKSETAPATTGTSVVGGNVDAVA